MTKASENPIVLEVTNNSVLRLQTLTYFMKEEIYNKVTDTE